MSSPLLPYTFDALLPTHERYASDKFRRVAQYFQFRHLDWEDALELVAFVESIGFKWARYILHWKGSAVCSAYARLRHHVGADADPYIRENVEGMGMEAGLAILKAMQDGGWKRGRLPWMVKMALKELRKRGMSMPAIGGYVGLTVDQVQTALDARKAPQKAVRAAAYGGLGL